jgi:group I intron endonuclease
MTAGIYRIRVHRGAPRGFALPDKFYIGHSADLERRQRDHLYDLKADRHGNIQLQRAYNKYGRENFTFETLIVCAPISEMLLMYEQLVVDAFDPELLYNILLECVRTRLGVRDTLETRQKKSRSRIGRKYTAETCAKISAAKIGKPRPRALIEKLRQINSGRKLTTEQREKIGARTRGTKQTEEHKERMRQALTGKKRTPEQCARIRQGQLGKKLSPEHAQKVRCAALGRKRSEETKRKMSEAAKAYCAANKELIAQRNAAVHLGVKRSDAARANMRKPHRSKKERCVA